MTHVNGVLYTYHNGNLLDDGTRTFTYDTANRLTQVVSGTLTTEYTYAGDGVRRAQTGNGETTRYVMDVASPLPQVLSELQVASGTAQTYLYGVGVTAIQEDGAWVYQHADALGSVRQVTDGVGQVILSQGYTPFGVPRYAYGQAAGTLGYAGEQRDAASGLTFLRARY